MGRSVVVSPSAGESCERQLALAAEAGPAPAEEVRVECHHDRGDGSTRNDESTRADRQVKEMDALFMELTHCIAIILRADVWWTVHVGNEGSRVAAIAGGRETGGTGSLRSPTWLKKSRSGRRADYLPGWLCLP